MKNDGGINYMQLVTDLHARNEYDIAQGLLLGALILAVVNDAPNDVKVSMLVNYLRSFDAGLAYKTAVAKNMLTTIGITEEMIVQVVDSKGEVHGHTH